MSYATLTALLIACCSLLAATRLAAASTSSEPLEKHYDFGLIEYRVYIPANTPVRGAIIASMGNNWDYRHFVEREAWRAAAAHWGFALIGTGRKGKRELGDAEVLRRDIETLFQTVAKERNDPDFIQAPFCVFGFSAGSYFSQLIAGKLPERSIAVGLGGSSMQWLDTHLDSLDTPQQAVVRAIPILATSGELDSHAHEYWQKESGNLREKGFMLAHSSIWGLSHYEGNYENLFLMHFDRAIAHRLPSDGTPQLRDIPDENMWYASAEKMGDWGTLNARPHNDHAKTTPAENRFIDESMATAWAAFSLRHNAASLRAPFCDSVEYVASRSLPRPHHAGHAMPLAATPHWVPSPVKGEFYANTTLIATSDSATGGPNGDAFTAEWAQPTAGIHMIRAVFTSENGRTGVTKPYPAVIVAAQP